MQRVDLRLGEWFFFKQACGWQKLALSNTAAKAVRRWELL